MPSMNHLLFISKPKLAISHILNHTFVRRRTKKINGESATYNLERTESRPTQANSAKLKMTDISETSSVPAIAVTAAVGAVVLLFVLLCNVSRRDSKKNENDDAKEITEEKAKSDKGDKPGKKSRTRQVKRTQSVQFSHPWLACTLRGHSGQVLGLDFSSNGKYLITTADDRSVLIWSTKEISQKDHKSIRGNIELDHATKVKFSPDSKAFITHLSFDNTLRIYRIGKKDTGQIGAITAALDFPKKHTADIICIGVASNGRFIMSCSSDTTIIIWSIKGEVLATIDTRQMNNSYGAVSPCGRFVASSGFTPDVKVWEVCFDKSGNFTSYKRAFELKGHSAGVYSFSFNNDSSRMASVSKDMTWKYWNTDIRYELEQDPYLLKTGSISFDVPCLISLSPDGRSVAVAGGNSICVYSAITGKEEENIEHIYSGEITDLSFDITSKYLVCTGDKHACVFNNITGYKATIADLEEKVKDANTSAQKERVKQQIKDAQSALDAILGTSNGHAESK